MARFAFDTLHSEVALHSITTTCTLDLRGAQVRINGQYLASCGCSVPLHLKLMLKGNCREDAHLLGLVEDMLRSECSEMIEDAASSALLLTSHLVSSYIATTHSCDAKT